MNGGVQSGGTTVKPIPNVRVTPYQAYAGSPMMIAQTSTDSNGAFSVPNASFKSDSFFYVTADLNDGILFMATLGPTVPVSIVINELTTVAATYSAAQFLVNASIQGSSFSLGIVAGMNANLVDVRTGASSTVMTTSPNADESSSCRTTLSLANALAACVWDRDKALQFLFRAATPPGGDAPTDTITAPGNIARNPANQGGAIYVLSRGSNARVAQRCCSFDRVTGSVGKQTGPQISASFSASNFCSDFSVGHPVRTACSGGGSSRSNWNFR